MTQTIDIDRFIAAPGLLVKLCEDVVTALSSVSGGGDTADMEAQLREIARAMEKLDKKGVPVPGALRTEKTRLAAALGVSAEGTQKLNDLANAFEHLLKAIRQSNGRRIPESVSVRKPSSKRLKSPKTSSSTLRQLIIDALQSSEGRARSGDVLKGVEARLKGRLLPGDLILRQDGKTPAWRNNTQWERLRMVRAGILRDDSPNGIWELSEEYR